MKLHLLLTTVIAASIASYAHANVWEDAIKAGAPDPAQIKYDSEMAQGDEHARMSITRSTTPAEVRNQVGLAVASYRAAALAKPNEAEPYFRIGRILYTTYIECSDSRSRSPLCNPVKLDRAKAEDVINAWDAFEQRAPLDPRISVGTFGESEILFRRAILRTKLATKAHLEAAAKDYEKILARMDTGDGPGEHVIGNLAETYMMVGRLEESIEMYKQALRGAADTSTWYGFAVALDRDERSAQAMEVISSLGRSQRDEFHNRVAKGDTFFVPEGEKFYYFALVDEALGFDADAMDYWRQYINSGAHPQYQPRAKAHLDALKKKQQNRPAPLEPPWRGILR